MGKRVCVVWGILGLTLILIGLTSSLSVRPLWSLNLLQFLPLPYHYAFWGLITIAAAILLVPSRFRLSRVVDGLNRFFFGPRVWPRLALLLATPIFFYLLRGGTHFLGDGYILLSIFGHGDKVLLKWTEPGAVLLAHALQTIQGGYSEKTALASFRLLSYLSGIICLWNFLSITKWLSDDPATRLVTLSTLVCSGVLVLFFGYVEHYPLVWATTTTFVALTCRSLKADRTLLLPIFVFFAACVIHLQILTLAPAVAYLGYLHLKRLRINHTISLVTIIAIVFCTATLVALLVWKDWLRIDPKSIFLPLFTGRGATPEYAAFSLKHCLDIANLTMLVYPGLISLAVLAGLGPRHKLDDPLSLFFTWGTLGSILFLVLVDPSLGMPRDWDLMSLTLLFPCLSVLRRLSLSELHPGQRLAGSYTIFCLALTLAFVATALNTGAAEDRMLDILRYNNAKNNTGWAVLSNYYQVNGESSRAQDITAEMNQYFPDEAKLSQAHLCLNRGEYPRALSMAEELYAKDQHRSDYIQVYGKALWKSGRLTEAISLYQKAIQVRPFFPHLKSDLGQIYIQNGQIEDALQVLKEARRQDPSLTFVSESIALAHINRQSYDSALAIADTLLSTTNDLAGAHLIKMVVAIKIGDMTTAKSELVQYLATGQSRSDYRAIKEDYAWVERFPKP